MSRREHPLDVFLTVDTEMWPTHGGEWPHRPLEESYECDREYDAYYFGDSKAQSGLPHQLEMLSRHGLRATFFVDPLFSFALGLSKLERIVSLIESKGQTIALHLHPEWLTDPRCKGLPAFRGPFLSNYGAEVQRRLIEVGWNRLLEAGAHPVRAFRAGNWGADLTLLRELAALGFTHDSSLNVHYAQSLPALAFREAIHVPTMIDGLLEVPVTRFADRVIPLGRPLSLVAVSTAEMRHILETCQRFGPASATIVLHSKEFTRTDRLAQGRAPKPMRLVMRRFQRLCAFLVQNRTRFRTLIISEATAPSREAALASAMPISSIRRTMARWLGQAVSRYY